MRKLSTFFCILVFSLALSTGFMVSSDSKIESLDSSNESELNESINTSQPVFENEKIESSGEKSSQGFLETIISAIRGLLS